MMLIIRIVLISTIQATRILKDYEAVRMIDADIQEDIDHILETLYYDETTGKIMQSVTIQGGDVEQVEFEG